MADPEGPADFGQGFPCLPSREGFEYLVAAELELSPKPYASGLCSNPAFRGPGLD